MNQTSSESDADSPAQGRRWALVVAAIGVVFGDIGTSPLYAFRECFLHREGVPVTPQNVIGILSLIIWALLLVISLKYLVYVLRADNEGEGGILALLTLVAPGLASRRGGRGAIVMLGLFGAALLYGDGMITPAISVLSAVEGLSVATPALHAFVIPLTVAILLGLFLVQRHGTQAVGSVFGPVIILWFTCLAAMGLVSIVETPEVVRALDPSAAVRFFLANGQLSFFVLGAVFLVITGGEALYADLGHFGVSPIRRAWFSLVLPALVLNYAGQAGLLIRQPEAVSNPFYLLAPRSMLYPLVGLATLATVIASQAVISGAFSLTRQALQLGYLPRLRVLHSSPHQIGQVYVPVVNWTLAVGTTLLVLGFRSSGGLASAYGMAVTTTMVITTLLAFVCARRRWKWSLPAALAITAGLLVIDLAFFGANLAKIVSGGWVPLVIALAVYLVMTTWKAGRAALTPRLRGERISVEQLLTSLERDKQVLRVPGTALFLDATPRGVPRTLLHNIKHNRVVHEKVGFLTVVFHEVPRIAESVRIEIERLGGGFFRVVANYGFIESPRYPEILRQLRVEGVAEEEPSVFLGRETLLVTDEPGMTRWRKHLFGLLARNAERPTLHFGIEPGRVVEIGLQVQI